MLEPRANNNRDVRILHIEDDPCDAELIEAVLGAHLVCQVTKVATKVALEAALERDMPDFIISDSSLPGFDGLAALTLAKQKHPEVPFIFCSGYISEAKKTETLKHGATDYFSKNNLEGLIALIKSLRGDAGKSGGEASSPQ